MDESNANPSPIEPLTWWRRKKAPIRTNIRARSVTRSRQLLDRDFTFVIATFWKSQAWFEKLLWAVLQITILFCRSMVPIAEMKSRSHRNRVTERALNKIFLPEIPLYLKIVQSNSRKMNGDPKWKMSIGENNYATCLTATVPANLATS